MKAQGDMNATIFHGAVLRNILDNLNKYQETYEAMKCNMHTTANPDIIWMCGKGMELMVKWMEEEKEKSMTKIFGRRWTGTIHKKEA